MSSYYNQSWQQQLSSAFKNTADLCEYLHLDAKTIASHAAHHDFPIRVPRSFADCIQKGNPNDPLLKQVLPVQNELINYQGFNLDPVGDLAATTEAGVIHKYYDRVLLITTGACAIHCRYCFRRNFPYSDLQLSGQKRQQAIAYIQQHPEINEVILSGGDPLSISDTKLEELIHQLETIPHLKRIRIHTRLPIVLPARITPKLLTFLKTCQKQIIMVVHCNHTQELSLEVRAACKNIREHGITLLNQTVLLKGVNNNATQLCELSEQLFATGILPYYLHLLDKAKGTGHFEVDKVQAIDLFQQMQRQLSGYLVPKLVQEQAGEASKTLIF